MSAERGSSQPIDAERDVFVRLPVGGDMSHCYCLSLGPGPGNRWEMGVVAILLSQLTRQILLVHYCTLRGETV